LLKKKKQRKKQKNNPEKHKKNSKKKKPKTLEYTVKHYLSSICYNYNISAVKTCHLLPRVQNFWRCAVGFGPLGCSDSAEHGRKKGW
jgi:hypothetical protein